MRLRKHLPHFVSRLAKQAAHFAFRRMYALHREETAVVAR